MRGAPGQEHRSSPAALPVPRCRCRCRCHCSAWGHTGVNSSPVAFWQSRMGEEPRSCWLLPRLCQRGARMADSTSLTLHPFNSQKTSQILFAFSDSDLLNYCKLGPESGTASHVHTQSHSTQTPQKELKQPPAPPEHLLCSEVFDHTHSAWVNDDGAAKRG